MEITDEFGADVAARYDGANASLFAPEVLDPQLDLLEELAGGSPVLELAIGTGRVGLPLARRGLAVTGIELSAAMVGRLRDKPGGDEASIPVVIGDMATARAPSAGSFGLVFLVFNTIMNLTTQEAQAGCFRNVAAHLEPGGCFVVEVGVPDLRRLPPGETLLPIGVSEGFVGLDEVDTSRQRLISHHVRLADDGTYRRSSIPFRYVWPEELDLMADAAGMQLRQRWSGWRREPFTHESTTHVSVWERIR